MFTQYSRLRYCSLVHVRQLDPGHSVQLPLLARTEPFRKISFSLEPKSFQERKKSLLLVLRLEQFKRRMRYLT